MILTFFYETDIIHFMSMLFSFSNFNREITPVMFFPAVVIVLILLFFAYYISVVRSQPGTAEWIIRKLNKNNLTLLNHRFLLDKRDIMPLVIVTIFFMILAMFNLGSSGTVDVMGEIHESTPGLTHLESMYFDEIYHVRTAVEHINNFNPYEATHPPLGKEIIAASILIFGESPFGWRLLGALLGVLMLPVIYILIKGMFGKPVVAVCATLLFGFDFMRYVQTRIATIDTFVVFFILLAFFFMYRYITTDVDAPFRKSLLPLALSGLFFGLGFAVKWVGFYAGAGLLVIYIIRLCMLWGHYRAAGMVGFGVYLIKTLLFSFLFFIVIPVLIYYISYIPYGTARGMEAGIGILWNPDFFKLVWSNQEYMLTYHSKIVVSATHPFSSFWWQWILNIRPILYVYGVSGELRATFGAFGNPVVWWGGVLAMIMMAVRIFAYRDGKALFILIGYLAQLLPWIAVTRIVFIYHYFPSTLFIILAFAHMFNTIIERRKFSGTKVVYGYTAVTAVVFAIFFPMMSGMYLPNWYYSSFLKWFQTWPF